MFRTLAEVGAHRSAYNIFKSLMFAISETSSVVVITEKNQNFVALSDTWQKKMFLITWSEVGTLLFSVFRSFKGFN